MSGAVEREPDGSLTWRADIAEPFLPVTLSVGQITLTVDAAFPAEPVTVTIRDVESVRSTSVFADPTTVEMLFSAEDTTGLADPVLSEGLIRLTTVTAVDCLHLGELDDGVLLLDVAYARALMGDPGADWYSALASSVPGRLVDEIESADHFGPFVARLAQVIGVVTVGALPDAETEGLLEALRVREERGDALWDALLSDLDTTAGMVATDLGTTFSVMMQVADLRALPARLLCFDGPEEPEVEVRDNLDGSFEVSARLRASVDADSAVAEGIFAIAADSDSGDLIAFAPATASDGRIVAHVDGAGGLGDRVKFAFVGSDVDPTQIRLDHFGVAMTRVDRHFRHAWTRHRNAAAILAGLGIIDVDSEISAATAAAESERHAGSEAVDTARMLLRQFARRYRAEPEIAVIEARRESVEKLADRLREPLRASGPGGSTLAELHMVGFR